MRILAIDTSCDESCVAIFNTDTWKLEADEVHSHIASIQEYGGIVPELVSREHLVFLPQVLQKALSSAGITIQEIDHIAVTNRPGLIGALLVGLNFGKGLAWANEISFSVEDHIEGHLLSPLLIGPTSPQPPPFPWIALIVSGGHTELFYLENALNKKWLGGTLDDAAGEAFDKIGKILGLGYPAGPVIDKLARTVPEDALATFRFPVAQVAPYRFSYSGLKTAVNLKVQSLGLIDDKTRAVLAACAQSAILTQLVREVRRALAAFPRAHAVVTGGVACNSKLRQLLPEAFFPQPKHCTDNAAMIAMAAAVKHREGKLQAAPWNASASARTDWDLLHLEAETAAPLGVIR